MLTANDLQDCPFCGTKAILETAARQGEPRYYGSCPNNSCCAFGPWEDNIPTAVSKWNAIQPEGNKLKAYGKMTWEQMAKTIHDIHDEASRRNPIGINFYLPYFKEAEEALLEIAGGEKDNPSSECGPTVAPEYTDAVAPFGWEPAPQWAKDAKTSDRE